MGVKLVSASGGSVEINPPATASNFVATMPAGTGTVAVQGASTNIVSGTSVTASGSSVDFTGIPSWVKRITVMFSGVSTSGTSFPIIRIGDSGGLENTGYFSQGGVITGTNSCSLNSVTGGWQLPSGNAANTIAGSFVVTNISGNIWVMSGVGTANTGSVFYIAGTKTLSDTLTQISAITSDTFDAGSINILYE
jgi:hypothetical protein